MWIYAFGCWIHKHVECETRTEKEPGCRLDFWVPQGKLPRVSPDPFNLKSFSGCPRNACPLHWEGLPVDRRRLSHTGPSQGEELQSPFEDGRHRAGGLAGPCCPPRQRQSIPQGCCLIWAGVRLHSANGCCSSCHWTNRALGFPGNCCGWRANRTARAPAVACLRVAGVIQGRQQNEF